MYLEIPDKDIRIENPTVEDILRELGAMVDVPGGDNCLDLCCDDGGFLQAIGNIKEGFFIRFKKADGVVCQSWKQLVLQRAQDILTSYLLTGSYPKDPTPYREIKTPGRPTLFSRLRNVLK